MMSDASPILILGPMAEEIELLQSALKDRNEVPWGYTVFEEGTLEGVNVVLVRSGVGKVLTTMLVQAAIDRYAPRAVINLGVAGALSKRLDIGDIIVAKDTVQHDMDATAVGFTRGQVPFTDYRFFPTDQGLRAKALTISIAGVKVLEGRIASGDQFITHSHPAREIMVSELAIDAVEMEGAAVGLVCAIHQVPYLAIRAISDKADTTATEDFGSFMVKAAKNSKMFVISLLRRLNEK